MKAVKPLKHLLHKTGLRKPLARLISSEFREVMRITEELKAELKHRGFDAVYDRHINGKDGYKKYLILDDALEPAIKPALQLGLFDPPPLRIFDIGCGPGYFLHVARQYGGHEVLGIDIDDTAIFNDLVRLLEIPRITCRVEAFQSLPDLGGKFDLITAMGIVFDLHRTENTWGPQQWRYLLNDCRTRLRPNGRIFLHFNPATTREFDFIPNDVAAMLRQMPGGKLSKSKEYFTLTLD
jgi:SAM-dependent methyltransferase